jgi:glycosyltransferase 2 family protein
VVGVTQENRMLRSISITSLKITLTALLLYLFLRRTDFRGIGAALSGLSIGLIAALALLNLLGVFISAYKWRMLLPETKFSSLTVACFVGYYFALLLPGQLAQEAAKAYYLSRGPSPRMHQIATSVVVDKIVSVIGLLLVGCMGLALSETRLPPSLALLFVSSGLLAIILLFSLRAPWIYSRAGRYLSGLGTWLPKQERIFSGGGRVIEAWHVYSKNIPLLVGNILLAVLYQLIAVLAFYLLSRGLQLRIGFFDWSWIIGALTLALFLPLTIGGLGVREGTLIAILGMYGYGKETAIAFSLVVFSFLIMLAIIGAALSFAIKPPSKVVI